MQKLLVIPIAVFWSVGILAQVRDRDITSHVDEVHGTFNPMIKDASKISQNPVIRDTTAKIPVSAYKLKDLKVKTTFEVEPIPSARMKPEPLTKLYSTHLKGGFGNYTMPLGEVYFNSLRSKEYTYGASLRHLSSSATLSDVAYSGFSNNNISLYGKYFMDNHTLSGDFDYARNVVHYYGFNPELNPGIERGDIRQRFNLFNPKVNFESTYKDTSKIHHANGLSYYNYSDLFDGAKENNISHNLSLRKYITREHTARLNTSFGYWHLNRTQDTTFNLIIGLNPHMISQWNKLRVKYGANIFMETSTDAAGSGEIFLDAEASYNLVDDIIIPYAGLTGGTMERNSYRSLTGFNPFMSAGSQMLNTVVKQKFFAGIKGNLSSELTFNTYFSYSNLENLPLFVNVGSLENRFSIINDNGRLVNLRGELAYQRTEKLKMLVKGDYYQYDLDNQEFAWHRPDWEATFTTFYSLRDKIIVKGDIFFVGKRMARDFVPTPGTFQSVALKPFLDVNMGLEYRYTKHISAFINFNNIGAVRYQRWYNYPTQRFNLMGGFTYSF